MDVTEALDILRKKAETDTILRAKLIATKDSKTPVGDFCRIAGENGCPIDEMDLVFAGEDEYAAIRRSTNGGGENSPLLIGSDDYYDMFIAQLKQMK